MNINVDVGFREDDCLNVDPLCQSQRGNKNGQSDEWWFKEKLENAQLITIKRVFERLKDGTHRFLIDLRKALADDGTVHLYIIDHDQFQYMARDNSDANQENCFGFGWQYVSRWVQNYKSDEIIKLFQAYGFKYTGTFIDKGQVTYPHWKFSFKKAYLHVPHEYVMGDMRGTEYTNTVDIGPGNFPWPHANNYIEHPSRLQDVRYDPKKLPDKNVFFGDLEKGIPEIKDKQFDFAFASHIFEHLHDPIAGAKELSRIAKRGIVVVPSSYKDAMCYWEEWEHRWDIFPPRVGSDKLRFVLRNEDYLKPLKNQEMQAIFGRLYRIQGYDTREERYVKQFFMDNEAKYDIVIEWKDNFEIETI